MPPAGTPAATAFGGTLCFFCLLWLAGLAMRMTLLVVPPVIPLIHEDLRMSETQIGLLIGLPLALFAIAAVPGSLLVARGRHAGAGARLVAQPDWHGHRGLFERHGRRRDLAAGAMPGCMMAMPKPVAIAAA